MVQEAIQRPKAIGLSVISFSRFLTSYGYYSLLIFHSISVFFIPTFFFRFRFFATVVLFLPSRWKTMLIVHRCQDSASHAGAFFFFFFCIPALFSGLLFLFFFHRVVFLLFGFIYLFISLGRNAVSRVVCCFSFIFYHEN